MGDRSHSRLIARGFFRFTERTQAAEGRRNSSPVVQTIKPSPIGAVMASIFCIRRTTRTGHRTCGRWRWRVIENRSRFCERALQRSRASFSPDGKWIAYESNESGGFEICVRRFPSSGDQWQISNRGGTDPKWRGDGKKLFYLSPNRRMMAATIRASAASIQADTPRELFSAPVSTAQVGTSPCDVTADGQRFPVGPGGGR